MNGAKAPRRRNKTGAKHTRRLGTGNRASARKLMMSDMIIMTLTQNVRSRPYCPGELQERSQTAYVTTLHNPEPK